MKATTFPDWLRRQLERREWTAADFARRAGVSTGVVSNWLLGRRVPSPKSCDLIADVLGVEVDTVLVLAGHRPRDEEINPDSPEGRIISLVKRIHWTDRDAEIIEAQLRLMIDIERRRANKARQPS